MPRKRKRKINKIQNQYSHLSSEYIVDTNPQINEFLTTSHKFYNRVLYDARQLFFKKDYQHLNYSYLDKLAKVRWQKRENMLYHQFPYVQSAQQTIKEVVGVMRAFSHAKHAWTVAPGKFTGRPNVPKYLKNSTKHIGFITNQNAKIKDEYLIIKQLNIKMKVAPQIHEIQRIAIKPVNSRKVKIIIQYTTNMQIDYEEDNGKYVGIDPGLDNAFTCVNNAGKQPLLINGRNIKSINQYYNKNIARLASLHAQYKQNYATDRRGIKRYYYSRKMLDLTDYRNRKIKVFAHKATKRIVDYALSCGANTIVIGKNKGMKRSMNLGKRTNQNFIGIPHNLIINMLTYKANLAGITVINTNENYTSQTSFLDNEAPTWQNGNNSRKKQGLTPNNRRIHRGLFKSNHGKVINADVNGAYQIIRKVFPNVSADGIEGVALHPVKQTILI